MAVLSDAQLAKLLTTGTTYRKELLAMMLVQLAPILQHMTVRTGIRGKEVVGQIEENAEMRPYRSAKDAVEGLPPIELRELETYLGDVVREFDPNVLLSTVYGGNVATPMTDTMIAKHVAMLMVMNVSNRFRQALFVAKRNATGDKTIDLFDGFCTIIDRDVAGGTVSAAKGNLLDLGEINSANVVDALMASYLDGSSEELQDIDTKMFIPRDLYNAYNRAYQIEFGATPYNKEYKKTFLEGTDDRCELVPMSGLKGTGKIILTTKDNLLFGCDQESDSEKVEIRRCDNPKALQFFMMSYAGVEFETISPQKLLVSKYTSPVKEA